MQKLFIEGTGQEVHIEDRDFITEGGEGRIYGKHSTAYKIYFDPSKMLPVQKVKELSALSINANIIVPQNTLLNVKNQRIGYAMRLIPKEDAIPLVCLFPKIFKQRHNIQNDTLVKLIRQLQSIVSFTHTKDILIVDLNEYNYLSNHLFSEIYAVDTNSYSTPSYKATVIMDTIRDRHCKNKFDRNTDWFSFGIVSFQLLIGMHPYKGSHPKFEHLPDDKQLDARMLANVSMMHSEARFPKVCASLDVIPHALRLWYKAIFEEGKRCAPPHDYEALAIIATTIKQITGTNIFTVKEIDTFPEEVIQLFSHETSIVIVGTENIFYRGYKKPIPSNNVKVGFNKVTLNPILFWIKDNRLQCFDMVNNSHTSNSLHVTDILEVDGRVYVKCEQEILEVSIETFTTSTIFTKTVGRVLDMPGATTFYDGFILQNVVGTYHASLFPSSGVCHMVKLPELKGYRIINAKYQNKVLVVIGVMNGKYDRFVFNFDFSLQVSYHVRKVENIAYSGINFAVIDKACVLLNEDEKIEVSSGDKTQIIDDPALEKDIKLHASNRIIFSKNKTLYSLSRK